MERSVRLKTSKKFWLKVSSMACFAGSSYLSSSRPAKIYPDTNLSDFHPLQPFYKQSSTVDLEFDQTIDMGIIFYFQHGKAT